MVELLGYKYQFLKATCLWTLYSLAKSTLITNKAIFSASSLISEFNIILKKGNFENKVKVIWIIVNLTQQEIQFKLEPTLVLISLLLNQLLITENIVYIKGVLRCLGNFLSYNITEYTNCILSNSKLYISFDKLMKLKEVL